MDGGQSLQIQKLSKQSCKGIAVLYLEKKITVLLVLNLVDLERLNQICTEGAITIFDITHLFFTEHICCLKAEPVQRAHLLWRDSS